MVLCWPHLEDLNIWESKRRHTHCVSVTISKVYAYWSDLVTELPCKIMNRRYDRISANLKTFTLLSSCSSVESVDAENKSLCGLFNARKIGLQQLSNDHTYL
ncbi:hypothetical protein Sjap_008837 [Stephania japonica]|uniref:Uncharacterized protein n=1 Tax=Stephania japonica TaxID=461633 RepID=A0AAP0JRW4_9MAGN